MVEKPIALPDMVVSLWWIALLLTLTLVLLDYKVALPPGLNYRS